MDNYSCGAAVVATLLASVTDTVGADDWHTIRRETSPGREHGTPTANLLRALRRLKFRASRMPNWLSSRTLSPALTAGDLVLTSIQMPKQPPGETHWVVIAGCSERDGILVLNCTGMPLFTRRWISWSDVDTRRSSVNPSPTVPPSHRPTVPPSHRPRRQGRQGQATDNAEVWPEEVAEALPFAAEAFRRYGAGEIEDGEYYPAEAVRHCLLHERAMGSQP